MQDAGISGAQEFGTNARPSNEMLKDAMCAALNAIWIMALPNWCGRWPVVAVQAHAEDSAMALATCRMPDQAVDGSAHAHVFKVLVNSKESLPRGSSLVWKLGRPRAMGMVDLR